MSRSTRKRSLLAAAILLVGFVLWSVTTAAGQGPGVGPAGSEPDTGGPSAAEAPAAPDRASAHAYLRAGDDAFAAGEFAAAELEYRRASEREPGYRAAYNLGVALARQGRHEEAAEAFARARRFAPADEPQAGVDAAYNAGTAAATTEDLEASVEAYVDALRSDPHDLEAKENLTQVLRQLRRQREQEQQQQQQRGGNGDPGEDEEPSDDEAPGDQPPPGGEPGDPTENEGDEPEESEAPAPGEEEGQPEEPSPAGAPEPARDVAREEAERLLELARDLERETQEKLKLGERTRARPEKDW